jgi:hypothetical protein
VDAIAEQGETADLLYNLGSAYCQAGMLQDNVRCFRFSVGMRCNCSSHSVRLIRAGDGCNGGFPKIAGARQRTA